MGSLNDIAGNLARVRERIESACARAGRPASEVQLVAVSKLHDASAIEAACNAGQRVFAENYVQESLQKAAVFANCEGLRLHFIGHLQSNKLRSLLTVPGLECIETLDRESLLQAMVKLRDGGTHLPRMLVQVQLADEGEKTGMATHEVAPFVERARSLEIDVTGLMGIGPATTSPRAAFACLRQLASDLNLSELSMGMSGDLEDAILEGSTSVRVGTAIFGAR